VKQRHISDDGVAICQRSLDPSDSPATLTINQLHPGSFNQSSPRRGHVFARLVQSLNLLMAWSLVIIEPVGPQLFLNLRQDVIGLLTDFLKCWCVHLIIHLISGAVSAGSDYLVTSPPTLPTETMVSVLEKLKVPSSFPCPSKWSLS
jgi:hypothetical protein